MNHSPADQEAPLPPLPSNVRVLGWVSFFTDVSSEMIFPLLPAFLTIVLGADPFVLGLIEGISDTTSSLLKLVSGYLSDRFKKRRFFVLLGYGLSSLLRPLTGLAPHWSMVLGIRFGDRVGKGLRTSPRDALIAQSVPASQAGRAFGFHQMMDHAGAVVGSLIGAGLIFLLPGKYRMIFLFAGAPALCALGILTRVREKEPIEKSPEKTEKSPPLPVQVKFFLGLLFFFTLGNATDAFLLLRLQVNGLPLAVIPLLWAGLHIIKASSNSWIGRLSDRGNRRAFLVLGWIFYAAVYSLFALPLPTTAVVLLFLAYGLFYGLTEPTEKALLKEWVPAEQYGTAYGLYHTVLGVALLPAGLFFGFLWKTWGYGAAFGFGAGITAVTAVVWIFWMAVRSTSFSRGTS